MLACAAGPSCEPLCTTYRPKTLTTTCDPPPQAEAEAGAREAAAERLHVELRDGVRAELVAELRASVRAELAAELAPELRAELAPQVRPWGFCDTSL